MKNKNDFKLENLFIFMINSFNEITQMLNDRLPMSTNSDDTDYRDAADTKRRLNVSDSTLYRWRKEGIIDFQIRKGKIYYDIASVLKKRK
ncbi:hypothetical protein [Epilithonimonas sp. UC225_85]|uniref:hypothetical protein n=1 Tax=Epilithonimonas sp. UC225_85 TaxID=3350167 RepID=UPI0036D2EAEA